MVDKIFATPFFTFLMQNLYFVVFTQKMQVLFLINQLLF